MRRAGGIRSPRQAVHDDFARVDVRYDWYGALNTSDVMVHVCGDALARQPFPQREFPRH